MTPQEMLLSLQNTGIEVSLDGRDLLFRPKGAIAGAQKALIRAQKPGLRALLRAERPSPCPVCRSAIGHRLKDGGVVCPVCDDADPTGVVEKLVLVHEPDGTITWSNCEIKGRANEARRMNRTIGPGGRRSNGS